MRELHIHLHLDRKLSSDSEGSIHVHLEAERNASDGNAGRDYGPSGRKKQESSGHVAASGDKTAPSGWVDLRSGNAQQDRPRDEQRIRSKVYRLDFVPWEACDDVNKAAEQFLSPGSQQNLMLELASGNQCNPIVWESFSPHSHRGLWRLSVWEDFGRLLGTVTYARDHGAIWVLPDWTPRGSLILEPVDPQRYPRLMLTPVPAFRR